MDRNREIYEEIGVRYGIAWQVVREVMESGSRYIRELISCEGYKLECILFPGIGKLTLKRRYHYKLNPENKKYGVYVERQAARREYFRLKELEEEKIKNGEL